MNPFWYLLCGKRDKIGKTGKRKGRGEKQGGRPRAGGPAGGAPFTYWWCGWGLWVPGVWVFGLFLRDNGAWSARDIGTVGGQQSHWPCLGLLFSSFFVLSCCVCTDLIYRGQNKIGQRRYVNGMFFRCRSRSGVTFFIIWRNPRIFMLRKLRLAQTPGEAFVEETGTAVTLPGKEYIFSFLVKLSQRWEVRGEGRCDYVVITCVSDILLYYVYTLGFLFSVFFPALS